MLGRFRLPVSPDIGEQRGIVSFIDKKTHGISKAIEKVENEIALIRQYRERMIIDVVTGKLDVREAAAKLPADIFHDQIEELLADVADEGAEAAAAEKGALEHA